MSHRVEIVTDCDFSEKWGARPTADPEAGAGCSQGLQRMGAGGLGTSRGVIGTSGRSNDQPKTKSKSSLGLDFPLREGHQLVKGVKCYSSCPTPQPLEVGVISNKHFSEQSS